jgi:hypothetical protein
VWEEGSREAPPYPDYALKENGMKRILIIILLCCFETAFAQRYPDLPLDKILSKEEQTQIGILKLTENEKEKLRILIIEKVISGYEKGKKDGIEQAAKIIESQQTTPNVIESQIDGDFEGWEGETIIKLMNGQVWQQSEYYYHYHYSFMPKVLIYRSGSGYKMKVDGIERAIGVTKLR